jgi:cyclase
MLKIRIIPTLLYKDFGLVKGERFNSWRRTGSAIQQIKVYNLREVDELFFLILLLHLVCEIRIIV